MKKVMILGIDGYLGWPLTLHLIDNGYFVGGVDNFSRRAKVNEIGSISANPIPTIAKRKSILSKLQSNENSLYQLLDVTNYEKLKLVVESFEPDVIVHLAEQPSGPYSMFNVTTCNDTMINNIIGTLNVLRVIKEVCPKTSLVKLGTMGEYGTPNITIPEGFFEIEYDGRKDTLPFPKQASSWYHQSKVHDSNNTAFACKIWNIAATDIMQGVVYGTWIPQMKEDVYYKTRLDFDSFFGTVINRFVVQVLLGHPITIYGAGGQRRGFIPIQDSIECMKLIIENPPQFGEYRVVNQLEKEYSINELAEIVVQVAKNRGVDAYIEHYKNPRIEMEDHYFKVKSDKLQQLGYKPKFQIESTINRMFQDISLNLERIRDYEKVILPFVTWSGKREIVTTI